MRHYESTTWVRGYGWYGGEVVRGQHRSGAGNLVGRGHQLQ